MNDLIIDIGNTTAKLAVYQALERKSEVYVIKHKELIETIMKLKFDEITVASVVDYDIDFPHKKITNSCKIPFENLYKNRENIGIDRLSGIVACYERYDKSDFLLIDVGTMITVEFFVGGKYIGGNISPGVKSRFNAINMSAPRLPKINKEEYIKPIGDTTRSAIAAGVINGIKLEIDGYINYIGENFPEIKKIIFTGGNGELFAKTVKKVNFATIFVDQFLVLDGIAILKKYNN